MQFAQKAWLWTVGLLAGGVNLIAAPPDQKVGLADLKRVLPDLPIVQLPASGTLTLRADQSYTSDDLKGKTLDPHPPALPHPTETTRNNDHTDTLPVGTGPYVAPGIEPFGLNEFTCEFNYGSRHNYDMIRYMSNHGYAVVHPAGVSREDLPPTTKTLRWGEIHGWGFPMPGDGRYQELAEKDVTKILLDSGGVWPVDQDLAMLDLEHPVPQPPEKLKEKDWFPKDKAAQEKLLEKYYEGAAKTYIAPVEAARQKGWKSVGVYPQPYGSGWYALQRSAEAGQSGTPDPKTYQPWLKWGRAMAMACDVLYPDIYHYFWSDKNVGYTLARIDFDLALVNSLPQKKPVRPYYWPVLHGGGEGARWWNQMPVPSEDMRAMAALTLFTGCDGFVVWDYGENNRHLPPPITGVANDKLYQGSIGTEVLWANADFQAKDENGQDVTVHRYDSLLILSVDPQSDLVKFRIIKSSGENFDKPSDNTQKALAGQGPVYQLEKTKMQPLIRPPSDPVSGTVEGLALVKPIEKLLRAGQPKVDVPALDQYVKALPLIRRVQSGNLHLVATYDPGVVHGGQPRTITLENFGGKQGRTATFPADHHTRIFVLQD